MKNFNYFKNFEELMKDLLNDPFNYDFGSKYFTGKSKTERGTDELGEWVKTTYESPDGSYSSVNFVRVGNTTKKTNSKTTELQKQLSKAVEEQNYEEAVKLRDKIRKIEGYKEKIESLKSELDLAVKNQDYEKAIELRDEIKKLEK